MRDRFREGITARRAQRCSTLRNTRIQLFAKANLAWEGKLHLTPTDD